MPNKAQAIILVGGQGTRLRPLTSDTPKPMLPIGGVPVIEHQIYKLKDAGINRIILGTSFKAEIFSSYFGDGSKLGVELIYAFESEPLGTGGAIRNAGKFLTNGKNDPVVVLNGDIMSNLNIKDMVNFWVDKKADVGLYLTTVDNPRAFGLVPTDDEDNVLAFLEKPKTDKEIITNQINAGCYIFKHSIIDTIDDTRPVSVEVETFPRLLNEKAKVVGYVDDCYWLDLGTLMSFVNGSIDFVRGKVVSSAYVHLGSDSLVAPSAFIADTASVSDGSFIDSGAVIKNGANIKGSAIFKGAIIAEDVSITNSIVGAHAVIAQGTVLDGVIVGNRAWVGAENELLNGARVWIDATLPDKSVRFSGDK